MMDTDRFPGARPLARRLARARIAFILVALTCVRPATGAAAPEGGADIIPLDGAMTEGQVIAGGQVEGGPDDKAPDPGLDVVPLVGRILGQLENLEGSKLWIMASRLEALGEGAVPALRVRLLREGEKGRLACARALLALGESEARAEATTTLEELARSGSSRATRVAAIEILAESGDPDDALKVLEEVLDRTVDPLIAIPLCRALWEIDHVANAREKLIAFLGSRDLEVKQEAALALAEIDYFDGDVREVLRVLKRSPTPEGRRAADLETVFKLSRQLDRSLEKGEALLEGTDPAELLKIKEARIRDLEEKLRRTGGGGRISGPKHPIDGVLEEVILRIQENYVDEAKTDRKRLILSAIEGMLRALDDFSSFLGVEETRSFRQAFAGEYPGIGAAVNKMPDGPLEIAKPFYGGPAHKAGILSGDKVLEVEGVRTDDLQLEDIIPKLKGEPGSKVSLKVYRRGWSDPKVIEIVRATVEVPSVHQEMLPGKLGYLQLQQFGDKSAGELIAALDALEQDGLAGLVIDLRNNGGGRLDMAIRIVDQFVKGDLPIVTQKGREGARDEVSTYPDPFVRPDYPIVVLINQRSASASEIVSGALKDFGRATLVGRRTFGKGSVQRPIPLSEASQEIVGGRAQIHMTTQYYFLPLGKCIHTIRDKHGAIVEQGGVEPDIEVFEDRMPAWRIEERERLRSLPPVLEYVDKHLNEIKSLFEEGDGHDTRRYPEFDDLFKALETTSPPEDLRAVLRFHVRRRLEDERGREFASDVFEDTQLQRAILVLLEKLGERPESYPKYAGLAASEAEK
ncbi:MAG TPA: S41 family peptidase [Planctomycetota bacterium]|nr:S41 family peptidase [Planctomycetota bacterium]